MAAIKVDLDDFAGMGAEEEAVYVAIESSPGIPARDLGKSLHRNMAAVLKVVQRLVDRGFVERRGVEHTQTFMRDDQAMSRTRAYNGLFVVTMPAKAVAPPAAAVAPLMGASISRRMGKPAIAPALETLRTSTVTVATRELDPARTHLRELGERLSFGRLAFSAGETRGTAFLPGRAISAGEESWQRALEELSDDDVAAAVNAGRRLTALLGV